MQINPKMTHFIISAKKTRDAVTRLMWHLMNQFIDPDTSENKLRAELLAISAVGARKRLAALWEVGTQFIVDSDHRWVVDVKQGAFQIAYQANINGSWITFGVNMVDMREPESVLEVIRQRTQSNWPADELEPDTKIEGFINEAYKVNGLGIWSVGRIILGLNPPGVAIYTYGILERLYKVAQYHKRYADIVDDVGIQHDRTYLKKIIDGDWFSHEKDTVAMLNSYIETMLQFFFKRGFYYQDSIDGGRLHVRSEEGSYNFNGVNATVRTINITYLTASSYDVGENEVGFCWECNNTEYFPMERPLDALLAYQARVDQDRICRSTGRGFSLEKIYRVQKSYNETTERKQEM